MSVANANNRPLPIAAGADVRAIVPQTLEDTFRIARYIWESGLAPRGLKNAEAVTVILLKGLELGIKPMTALEGITVINGKPSIGGNLALALARGSGLLENFVEECDGKVAICTVRRKGDNFDMSGQFSIEDAKVAGLWGKDGPWRAYPKRMLGMRARGFALRDAFGDVLGGMILTEELETGNGGHRAAERGERFAPIPDGKPEPVDPDAVEEGPAAAFSDTPQQEPTTSDTNLVVGSTAAPPVGGKDWRAWVGRNLAACDSLDEAAGFWDRNVAPVEDQLFPPDHEDLLILWRLAEERLRD